MTKKGAFPLENAPQTINFVKFYNSKIPSAIWQRGKITAQKL